MDLGSSIFFRGFIFDDLFEVLGKGDLEAVLIVLVESVVLEGVESNGGLEHVFKVDKA
jgi:hypothetical protein